MITMLHISLLIFRFHNCYRMLIVNRGYDLKEELAIGKNKKISEKESFEMMKEG